MSAYTIRFTFPDADQPMYAGDHKGAMGWARGLTGALMWDDPDVARRFLQNGYGSAKRWGEVVEVKDGEVVAVLPALENGWVNA